MYALFYKVYIFDIGYTLVNEIKCARALHMQSNTEECIDEKLTFEILWNEIAHILDLQAVLSKTT